jgi:hypothetical protein
MNRFSLVALTAGILIVAALIGGVVVPSPSSPTLLDDSQPKPHIDDILAAYDKAVVVVRHEERSYPDEDIAFRNSLLGIYDLSGETWNLLSETYPVRTTATSRNKPTGTESDQLEPGETIRWGHDDVPSGVYSLSRTDNYKRSGRIAYLISEMGRNDGQIRLQQPQVLHTSRMNDDGTLSEISAERQSRWYKQECYLHSSYTLAWSHSDSNGCLNLYDPYTRDDPGSDWNRFRGELDSNLQGPDDPLLRVIIDRRGTTLPGQEKELPATIPHRTILSMASP